MRVSAMLAGAAFALLATAAFVGVICATFKNRASFEAPTAAAVQAAYDAEGTAGDPQHSGELKVVGVQCRTRGEALFTCEVGFTENDVEPDRVFLDAATLEWRGNGYKLLRGLCRRLL